MQDRLNKFRTAADSQQSTLSWANIMQFQASFGGSDFTYGTIRAPSGPVPGFQNVVYELWRGH